MWWDHYMILWNHGQSKIISNISRYCSVQGSFVLSFDPYQFKCLQNHSVFQEQVLVLPMGHTKVHQPLGSCWRGLHGLHCFSTRCYTHFVCMWYDEETDRDRTGAITVPCWVAVPKAHFFLRTMDLVPHHWLTKSCDCHVISKSFGSLYGHVMICNIVYLG